MPIDREETHRKAEQLLREGKIELAIAEYRAVASPAPTLDARYALLYKLAAVLEARLDRQSEAGKYRDVASRFEQLKGQTGGAAC